MTRPLPASSRAIFRSFPLVLALPSCADRDEKAPDATQGADTQADTDADTAPEADIDSGTDTGADTDTIPDVAETCAPQGFSQDPTLHTLPAAFAAHNPDWLPFHKTSSGSESCGSGTGTYAWSTLDLTGDGRLDLVVFRDDCTDAGIGASRWDVYEGHRGGFAETPTAWALPTGLAEFVSEDSPFDAIEGTLRCADGANQSFYYYVLDVTGDGWLDFVLSGAECLDAAIGRTRWDVYPGSSSGFAATPVAWALPSAFANYNPDWFALVAPGSGGDCGDGSGSVDYAYRLLDLTGDGVLDLTLFYDECRDPAIGEAYWWVYEGGATGFAEDPLSWTLPTNRESHAARPFDDMAGYSGCYEGTASDAYYSYSTLDLTGDGLLDLVIHHDDCGLADGNYAWRVHEGDGAGFDPEGSSFLLPAAATSVTNADGPTWSHDDAHASCDREEGHYWYRVTDLSNDGLPDLVLTLDTCLDPGIGSSHWNVYTAAATGFSEEPATFTLPTDFVDYYGWPGLTPLYALDGELDCDAAEHVYGYTTIDLTNDSLHDLVLTFDQCRGGDIGREAWAVYAGTCE